MFWIPIAFAMAALAASGLNSAALNPWRSVVDPTEQQRARLLVQARVSRALGQWTIPCVVYAIFSKLAPESPSVWIGLAALAGALLSGFFFDRVIHPDWRFGSWVRYQMVFVLPKILLVLATIAGLMLMPPQWSPGSIVVILGFLIVAGLVSAGTSYAVSFQAGLLQPTSVRIGRIARKISGKTGFEIQGYWETDVPFEYAAALVTHGVVIISTKLQAERTDEEIEAIFLQEAEHMTQPRMLILARAIYPVLLMLPFVFIKPADAAFGLAGTAFLLILPVVVQWGFLELSARLEKNADGALVEEAQDATKYLRAIINMCRSIQIPAVLRDAAPHTQPDHFERTAETNATPDQTRPKPPVWYDLVNWGLAITLAVAVVCLFYN